MTYRVSPLTGPGRHVLEGAASEPRFSSFSRGWRGVALELFGGREADFTGVFENHGIAVHLEGCVDLYQRYEGQFAHTEMRRGNITITPAGATKRFQHPPGGEFVVVHLAPALLSQVAEAVNAGGGEGIELIHNFSTRDPRIEKLAHQLCSEYRTQDIACGIYAESLANQLIVHLLRHHSTARRIEPPMPSKLSAKALKIAIDYIEANLASDLTLTDMARLLAMSPGHFAHAFRNSIGIPPHRYIVERRIESAKAMLRDTDLPIATIAALVGFSTHSHFCTTFLRVVGEAPRSFRSRPGST